jgi:hypothetical protein
MIPKCCEHCPRCEPGGRCLGNYHIHCASWRMWFSGQWSRIRRAAQIIKENKEAKK